MLPIVMNTPFLLDDGTVSEAYGTLGKGMHAGLPGHSFVLIDKHGQQQPAALVRRVPLHVAGARGVARRGPQQTQRLTSKPGDRLDEGSVKVWQATLPLYRVGVS